MWDRLTRIGYILDLAAVEFRNWKKNLGYYQKPNHTRSIAELLITVLPLVTLWIVAWLELLAGVSLVVATGRNSRSRFSRAIIFDSARLRSWHLLFAPPCERLGRRVIGVVTLTPYDFWRRTHSIHHATAGNLDRRGIGDVTTLTVREYFGLSWSGRLKYRGLQASIGDVCHRSCLLVFSTAPSARRLDA